ncbi:MAG: hypothetical protein HGA52_04985 [Bacteroidales bacterium]|nr:hypothetical protein [Bacteroidales bacterium]
MKSRFLNFLIIIFILMTGSFSANAQIKKACIGKWSFDAPGAPDGYTYGLIEISKDSVKTSFTTSNFKFPSIWVKAKNDSVTYKASIDGTDVIFSLKLENETSIKGNAVWYEGETLMILRKKED